MGELKYSKIKIISIILIFSVIFVSLIWAMTLFLPPAIDWEGPFYNAGRAVLRGQSPYNVPGFYNAPWTALFLMPFSLFPLKISQALMIFSTLISIVYISHKLGAKPIAILFILLSPPILHSLLNGNIDWMALLGIIMPPQIGLFFVSIKPQTGLMIAVFWFFEAWRGGGIKQVIKIFWPISFAFLLSFIIFGFWPLKYSTQIDLWWNASLWPYSLPIGLLLMYYAYSKLDIKYAISASPFFSPYVLLHSWIAPIIAFSASVPGTIIVVSCLWILVIIQLI